MLQTALVGGLSIVLAKLAIMWCAWRRSDARHHRPPDLDGRDPTDGAWFRLPVAVITVASWASGAVVGALAFLCVHDRWWGAILAVVSQASALAWARFVWADTAHRIDSLLVPNEGLQPPPGPVDKGGKTIVILCDGTGNRPDALGDDGRAALTNVRKFYEALADRTASDWTQVKWYDSGVGTFSSRRSLWLARLGSALGKLGAALPAEISGLITRIFNTLELATGMGIVENVAQGYAEIVRRYEPGDRIAILGFSRGAYTARLIAGVIARCGLLRKEYARFANDVVQIYRYRSCPERDVHIRREMRYSRSAVPIHFLGLWDTVASLGAPLWGWWFALGSIWRQRALDTSPAVICLNVCHALSIDERRAQFFPTLFAEPRDGGGQITTQTTSRGFTQTIEQVWFRGAHADVGGGYAESALSDIALDWMMDRATKAGLQFNAVQLAANPRGDMHDEMVRVPGWNYFGSWPRWHPCPREGANVSEGFGYLDSSVYRRADHARARRQARAALLGLAAHDLPLGEDEIVFLDPGDRARIRVDANRAWNRTGLVFEQGARYRFQLARGAWQDKECASTGPEGQAASRQRDLRGRFGWARRLSTPQAQWMTLIATVAHPRPWPLREKGAWELLYYLVREDPKELRDMLIPLGGTAAGSVEVGMLAASGMLHCFANDLWAFYDNNSGAIELDVTRLAPDPSLPPPSFVVRLPLGGSQ